MPQDYREIDDFDARDAEARAESTDDEPLEIAPSMLDRPRLDFERRMNTLPLVTVVLASVCVAVFLAQIIQGALVNLDGLIRVGALHGGRVGQGEYWRLLSAVFLHGGFDHLFGNLVALFILGMAAEHAFGRAQFITLFVACGVAGSLCSLIAGNTSVGASGAIFGVMGALIVFFWRHRHDIKLRDSRIGVVLAVWAAYQLALGMMTPQVDNLAHIGGLIGGAVLGVVLLPAVLIGREEAGSHPFTLACATLALSLLAVTAICFLPRLLG